MNSPAAQPSSRRQEPADTSALRYLQDKPEAAHQRADLRHTARTVPGIPRCGIGPRDTLAQLASNPPHQAARLCLLVTVQLLSIPALHARTDGGRRLDPQAQSVTLRHVLFGDYERPTIEGKKKATRDPRIRQPLSALPFIREPSNPVSLASMGCLGADRVT